MNSLRMLSVIGVLCISQFSHAKFCKEETDDAKKNCKESAVLAGVNNDGLAATAKTAAGSGGIINKGGGLESSVFSGSIENIDTAKESCQLERKKAREACENASRESQSEPGSLKEIQDNWDNANSFIEGRQNGLDSSRAYLIQQSGVSNQVSSLSH